MVRKFEVTRALESFGELTMLLNDLTEEEVLAALNLESATRRRRSFIDRLISRAVRLNEVRYSSQLKEKYHHG
jgi:hypothetical protein